MNEIQTIFNSIEFKSLLPLDEYLPTMGLALGLIIMANMLTALFIYVKHKKIHPSYFKMLPQSILIVVTITFFLVSISNKEIDKKNLESQKHNETLFVQFKNSLTNEQKQLLNEKLSEQHLKDSYEDISKLFKGQL